MKSNPTAAQIIQEIRIEEKINVIVSYKAVVEDLRVRRHFKLAAYLYSQMCSLLVDFVKTEGSIVYKKEPLK